MIRRTPIAALAPVTLILACASSVAGAHEGAQAVAQDGAQDGALPGPQQGDRGADLVTLPAIFSDHMVLQRGEPIVVWGAAPEGTEIDVAFARHRARVVTGVGGEWRVTLPAVEASRAGRNLRIRARLADRSELTELHDVVTGDVWFCSGQSNMRWRVRQAAEAAEWLEALGESPALDLRLVDFEGSLAPDATRWDLDAARALEPDSYFTTSGWAHASMDSAPSFSAVAYAFGRALDRELDVPIGLVHNAIGGSPMESWLPAGAEHLADDLAASMASWWSDPTYPAWCVSRARENLAAWIEAPSGERPHHPFEPSFLFDAGIAPLGDFAVRGVVWYQGESNASDAGVPRDPARNRAALTSLIRAFRETWGKDELPVLLVQLPGMSRPWALFREVQLEVARATPGVEMAIAIDLGHPTDVHPKRKAEVGGRLARLALAQTYGRGVVASGPVFTGPVRFEPGRARIRFEHAAGLRTSDGRAVRGFELAGADRRLSPASAAIEGDEVVVTHAGIDEPVAVRYAFADDPAGNLINAALLPASPFRTDRWKDATHAASDGVESFERALVGPIRGTDVSPGRLEADAGHAEITDRFARSGRRCLHLLGGENRATTLTLASEGASRLSFWAERWTRRAPFEFRVDARGEDGADGWSEVWMGDGSVRVGARLLSHVRVDLPAGTSAVRFRCTAPEGTGVLIDDLFVSDTAPMRLVAARHDPWVAPALHGKAKSAVTKVGIRTVGSTGPLVLEGCRIVLPGSIDLGALERVSVHVSPTESFEDALPFGAPMEPARSLVVRGRRALDEGETTLWIAVELAEGAGLDGRVAASVAELSFEGRPAVRPIGSGSSQRVGVVVRAAGQDGSHTYRIPGLATTNAGTLIAVYDCRHRGSGDLPGDIDVGMSRSVDGGRTWSERRVVMDMGEDPAWSYDGVGDPAVLVDRVTGTIWVAATWSHGPRSWNGSGPGLEPEETGQVMLVRSDDDGLTWSHPVNITRQVKRPAWRFVLPAPGAGITLADGTLAFPAQYRSADDSPFAGRPFSTLMHSEDRGATWTIGTGVKVDTTESQVVELEPGVLMINCRDNRRGSRSVYTTTDLGKSWAEHPSSRHALPEPTCMASLLRVEHPELGRVLAFSNPACRDARRDMTIKLSVDDGRTWPVDAQALFDQRTGFGYSCLAPAGPRRVGVLYEGRRELYFLRFDLDELLAD